MKKLITFVLIVSLLTPAVSLGQTDTIKSGMLPTNPLYFLKTIKEEILLFFTFNQLKKASALINYADTRTAEIESLEEKGRADKIPKTLSRYEKQLSKALDIIEKNNDKKEIDDILINAREATSKHITVLNRVLAFVPENAKDAIKHAIETSQKGQTKVIQILQGKNINQVLDKLKKVFPTKKTTTKKTKKKKKKK